WNGRDVSKLMLEKIGNAKWPAHVNLDWSNFDNTKDLAALAKLPHLFALGVSNTNFDDRGLEALVDCPELGSLEASSCLLDDHGMPTLRKFKHLTYIKLMGNKLTEKGFKELSTMGFLRELSLHGISTVNDDTIALFQKSNLSNFYLQKTAITDAA